MRASVLIGGLIACAVLLLFLPALGGPGEAVEAPLALVVQEPAPAAPPSWPERLQRPEALAPVARVVAEGRWSEVEADLATGRSAKGLEADLLVGLARLRTGRAAEALGPLEAAARRATREKHPLAALAWARLGEAAQAAERPELALEAREAAWAARPTDLRLAAALATARVEAGQEEQALALVRDAAASPGPKDARAELLAAGLALEPAGEDERDHWRRELGWTLGATRPARALAGTRAWKAELDRALAAGEWQRVLDRLEALVVADRAGTALPEIEALLAVGPPPAVADRARQLEARSRWVKKDYSKALAAARKVGDSDGAVLARAAYVGALSARSLRRSGDYRRLLEASAEAGACEWRDRAVERLADRDVEAGRRQKARERWQLLAEQAVTPARQAESSWHRAWSWYEDGEADDALAAFTDLVGRHPRRPEAAASLYWSARLLRDGGAPEEAGRRMHRLVEEHPFDYYGLLAANELHLEPELPPVARAGELEALLAARLEALEERAPEAAERCAALWSLGLVDELLDELEQEGVLDERHWALRVALLGEAGRHRAALVSLREAVPEWRTRRDLPAVAWSAAYPRAYAPLVESNSAATGLDPALVYALIHQESVFDADAVSHAGARGLMQIMPGTNRTIARWFNERARTSDLVDPEHNVRYGTAYLRRLLDNLGEPELALAGYNAGGARARRWWADLPEQDLALFVESIPFDETRHYVKSVTWNRAFYRGVLQPAPAVGVAQ